MMNMFSMFLFLLIVDGVFGVDTEDVNTVTEGDSLTLEANFTEIQTDGLIEWECNGTRIAKINKQTGKVEYSDKIMFSDRLTLDQTGFLTIWNIRIKHSGEYKVEGTSSKGTKSKTFRVIVKESPLKSVEDKYEIKTLSVTEGHSETLHTDTELQKHDLILWRFGAEGSLIAKGDLEDNITSYYDGPDGRFRDRLKINSKTGSLTITDINTEHVGEYQLKIISDRKILYKRFTVTVFAVPVPGLSSGDKAGIVVGVLLGVFSAAVVLYFFYRRKISELERQKLVSVSVKEGDPATLNTDVNEIQRDDQIEWRFGYGGALIAQIKGGTSTIYNDVLDGRFRGRLKLSKKTGSLTITNIRTTDSGLYELQISRDSEIKHKKFSVSVCVSVSAIEGDDVTLKTDAEIQRDDQIEWRVGNRGPLIAQIKGGTSKIYDDVLDGKFRGRLKLGDKTGYLTITNSEMKHAGVYELKIKSGSEVSYMKFTVTLRERKISVEEGKNVTLNNDTEIQRDDQILWMCGENLIAQIKGGAKEMCDDVSGGRFRDRLELDEKTGSLTIKDMRIEESGLYKLQIISSRGNTNKRFFVTVNEKLVSVYEGDPVILVPDTEIHREDQILWLFKERNFEIKGGIREITCDGADGRFKDRLKLDKTTGSLTITNTRTTDSGDYKLQIKSSSGVSYKIIKLHVRGRMIPVEEGNPVTLETKAEIQTDDQILWTFEDTVIVQMTGETGGKYDDAKGIFKGRLELDKTGSLTITNMRTEHSGVYKLQISSSRGTKHLYKTFKVVVVTHVYETKTVIEGEDVTLPSSAYIEVNEIAHWLFKNETLAIGMDGDISKTSYFDERFRDRLQLDHQTGSLTIKNIRTSDTGHYYLKLLRCGIDRKFSVTVSVTNEERKISVEEGKNVTLNTDTEIQRDDQILWMCGENLIAQIKGGAKEMCDDVSDGRFKGRLELDETTGSLTIKDMRIEESGVYKLHIISSRGNTYKRFFVTVNKRNRYVAKGEPVTLNTDTKIQRDDLILWMCGENLIAQIKGGTKEMCDDVSDGRFKDRLELDEKTGSLTIKDMRIEESGLYKLHIISSRGTTYKRFFVSVLGGKAPPFPVKKLKSGSTEHRVNESASLLKPQSDREIPDGAKESVTVVMPQSDREIPDGVNESSNLLKPQSDREIPDGAKESVTVVMPLLSDVNEQQETSSV